MSFSTLERTGIKRLIDSSCIELDKGCRQIPTVIDLNSLRFATLANLPLKLLTEGKRTGCPNSPCHELRYCLTLDK